MEEMKKEERGDREDEKEEKKTACVKERMEQRRD